ncbi:MAG: hypothetical protein ABH842_05205 [Candidatus Micrarchaeota archaeon]
MVTMDEHRKKISFLKTELMPFLASMKNDKEKLNLIMYVFYPDILREYKKIKATKIFDAVPDAQGQPLLELYNDITKNATRYGSGIKTLTALNQKLTELLGAKYTGIKNPESFSKLGASFNLLRSKFGKDIEPAKAELAKMIMDALGLDEATATQIVSDQNASQSLTGASQDFTRAKSMGVDTISKFSSMVAEVFKQETAKGNFDFAYNYLTTLFNDAKAERRPGDVTEYVPEFVNSYVELYSSMFEPFEVPEYSTIEQAQKVLQDSMSKNYYGNTITVLLDLLNAGATGLDTQTNQLVAFMKEKFGSEQAKATFTMLEKHQMDDSMDIIAENANASKYSFFDLDKFSAQYGSDLKETQPSLGLFTLSTPRTLYKAMEVANENVPKTFQTTGVSTFYNVAVKFALMQMPLWQLQTVKKLESLLQSTLNSELLADKSDDECKKYYSENYLRSRGALDRITKSLKSAKELNILSKEILDSMLSFVETRAPPLLKAGEAAYLEKLDTIQPPKDGYTQPDLTQVKQDLLASQQKLDGKGEKTLGIIVSSPDWELIEEKKWKMQGDTLVEYINRYRWTKGYIIVERGDSFYWAYPVGFTSLPYQNSWGKPYVSGTLMTDIIFLSKKNTEAAGLLMVK